MLAFRYLALMPLIAIASTNASHADDFVFDELRFGASASVQGGHSHEDGSFAEMTAFFDPFDLQQATDWRQQLKRPRINLGTSISSDGETNQIFGGLAWQVSLTDRIFGEAGFGGVWHDGELRKNSDGPILGCRILFHEYIGAGYRLDTHWSLFAQVAHSSHADLCDGPNNGMTRAGIQVGYRF